MASRSKDGEIIARWLARNGVIPARGSTRKGGGTALQEMIELVQAGHPAALTVDGPKGPPRVVQPGILQLARRTGAWILPVTGASTRPWFLKSWDRYLVPKPFSRCVVSYGEPFPIPEEGDERGDAGPDRRVDRRDHAGGRRRRAGSCRLPPGSRE